MLNIERAKKSYLDRKYNFIKDNIFILIHQLLKVPQNSIILHFVHSLLCFIQLSKYFFTFKYEDNWTTSLKNANPGSLSKLLNINIYLDNLSYEMHYGLIYFASLLLLILIGMFIYHVYYLAYKAPLIPLWGIRIFKYSFVAISGIFYLPFLGNYIYIYILIYINLYYQFSNQLALFTLIQLIIIDKIFKQKHCYQQFGYEAKFEIILGRGMFYRIRYLILLSGDQESIELWLICGYKNLVNLQLLILNLISITTISIIYYWKNYSRLFLSIYDCKTGDSSTDYLLSLHDDQKCFDLVHVITMIVAGLNIFLIVFFAIGFRALNFEFSKNSTEVNAKINMFPDILQIIYKTLFEILFTFFTDDVFDRIFAFVMTFCWFLYCFSYFNIVIYYNRYAQKIFEILGSLKLCTSVILLISVLFKLQLNYILLFFLYILITFVQIYILEWDKSLLYLKYDDMRDYSEVLSKLYWTEKLIEDFHKGKREDKILLKGYLLRHIKTCTVPKCSLSAARMLLQEKITKRSDTRQLSDCDFDQIFKLLTDHMKDSFRLVKHCFPKHFLLKLLHLDYLLKRDFEESMVLVGSLEGMKMSISEQVIFSHLKQSVFQLMNQRSGNNIEIKGFKTLSISAHKFADSLKEGAQIYAEFWYILQEPNPNLSKTIGICGEIQNSNEEINNQYLAILNFNSGTHKISRLYSKYLAQVVQDPYYAQIIIEKYFNTYYNDKLKHSSNNAQFKKRFKKTVENTSIDNGRAFLKFSCSTSSMGEILSCNSEFGSMFGHDSKDISAYKLNVIFPEIYVGYIYSLIESSFLDKRTEYASKKWTKNGFLVLGKHKNGYMFLVSLKLEYLPQAANYYSCICSLAPVKGQEKKNIVYFLLNKEHVIMGITSNCINLMRNMNKNILFDFQVNIADIFPEINLLQLDKYPNDWLSENVSQNSQFQTVVYAYPYVNHNRIDFIREEGILRQISTENVTSNEIYVGEESNLGWNKRFKCRMEAIEEDKEEGEIFGHLFLAEVQDNSQGRSRRFISAGSEDSVDICKKKNIPNFQFTYIDELNAFIGQPMDKLGQKLTQVELDKIVCSLKKNKKRGLKLPNIKSSSFLSSEGNSSTKKGKKRFFHNKGESKFKKRDSSTDTPNKVRVNKEEISESEREFDIKIYQILGGYGLLSEIIAKLQQQYLFCGKNIGFKDWLERVMELDIGQLLDLPTYGAGIKTMTWKNGIFLKTDGHQNKLAFLEADLGTKVVREERRKDKEQEINNFLIVNNLKGRKDVENLIGQGKLPKKINILNITYFICLILILALVITQNVFNLLHMKTLSIYLDLLEDIYASNENMIIVLFLTRKQPFEKLGQTINTATLLGLGSEATYNRLNEIIYERVLELQEFEELKLDNLMHLKDNHELFDAQKTKNIEIIYLDENGKQSIQNETLSESIKIILNAIALLTTYPYAEVDPTDPLYKFIHLNTYHQFLLKYYNLTQLYFNEFMTHSEGDDTINQELFFVTIGLCLLFLPIGLGLIYYIESERQKIYDLILEIPMKNNGEYEANCLQFQKEIDGKDYEEIFEYVEEYGSREDTFKTAINPLSRNYRGYKCKPNIFKPNITLIFWLVFSLLLLCAYFVGILFDQQAFYHDLKEFSNYYSLAGDFAALTFLTAAIQKELYKNDQEIIFGRNVLEIANEYTFKINNQSKIFEKSYGAGGDVLSDDSKRKFRDILDGDMCPKTDYFNDNLTACHNYNGGIFQNGLIGFVPFMTTKTRLILNIYLKLPSDSPLKRHDNFFSEEFAILQFSVLFPFFRNLNKILTDGFSDAIETRRLFYLGIMISLSLLAILCYFIIWRPLLTNSKNRFLKSKKIVALLPIKLLMKIKPLFKYLEKQINTKIQFLAQTIQYILI